MRKDLVDITLVVDRSGSMAEIQSDAEGSINAFVKSQAALPGEALFTLVQFHTEIETLFRGLPMAQIPPYHMQPAGSTALLDAIGVTIQGIGHRLEAMKEEDRPGLVIVVVMTDGEENSSTHFSKMQIRQMIEHQQQKYGWQFTFLGADQDAFAEAAQLGVDQAGTANYAKNKIHAAMRASSSKVARMRGQLIESAPINNAFTPEEIHDMQ